MTNEPKVQSAPTFFVDGRTVNGRGQEVDEKGQVKGGDEADVSTGWEAERERLLTELQAAKANALPEDAEARLEAVPGISKALAQKALAALTAQEG